MRQVDNTYGIVGLWIRPKAGEKVEKVTVVL